MHENSNESRKIYSTNLFTERALEFICAHYQEKFFLYLPYTAPHVRYEVPYLGVYADRPWSDQEKIYAAMVGRLDRGVGQILDLLDELSAASSLPTCDGLSILPTLLGNNQDLSERFLYWEQSAGKLRAARRGDWKYRDGQLFNLANDPHEDHDLASQQPQLVSQFKHYIQSAHQPWSP